MTRLEPRTCLRPVVLFAATAVFASGFGANSSRAVEESQTDAPSQLERGAALLAARSLYRDACGSCHGDNFGELGSANVDFSSPQALIDLTPEAIATTLRDDAHAGVGPTLSDDERAQVVGYLRNFLMLPAPEEDTGVGRRIYSRSCSVCHGERGDAASWAKRSLDPPPANFASHALDQLSREEMIHAVTFGKDRTAMMPFAVQLNAEEIAATVDYIRVAFMTETGGDASQHGGHDHGNDHAHGAENAFPDGLRGDKEWGRAFYNANCAECHGRDGDGEGPRAYFMLTKPKNFRTEGARAELDRPTLFQEISHGVKGTTMPAWSTVLTNQEIANVAEYVYGAFLSRASPDAPAQDHMRGQDSHPHDGTGHGHGESHGSKKN